MHYTIDYTCTSFLYPLPSTLLLSVVRRDSRDQESVGVERFSWQHDVWNSVLPWQTLHFWVRWKGKSSVEQHHLQDKRRVLIVSDSTVLFKLVVHREGSASYVPAPSYVLPILDSQLAEFCATYSPVGELFPRWWWYPLEWWWRAACCSSPQHTWIRTALVHSSPTCMYRHLHGITSVLLGIHTLELSQHPF